MATTDIPPYVPAAPDDLIRSEDINTVQRLARTSVRGHRHTLVAGAPSNDGSPQDVAVQLASQELADLGVTTAKLGGSSVTSIKLVDGAIASAARIADNAVSTARLQDAAVSAPKLAATAVARGNIQDGSVSRGKLALVEVNSGSQALGALGSTAFPSQVIVLVRANLPDTANTLFLPSLTLSAASGTGTGQVESALQYRRGLASSGPVVVDLLLRLTNTGTANVTVNWRVSTFAPFNPPYPFGIRAGIGGELI